MARWIWLVVGLAGADPPGELLGDDVDGHLAGLLAGELAAHAVGDDEEVRRARRRRGSPGWRRGGRSPPPIALPARVGQVEVVLVVLAVVADGRDDADPEPDRPRARGRAADGSVTRRPRPGHGGLGVPTSPRQKPCQRFARTIESPPRPPFLGPSAAGRHRPAIRSLAAPEATGRAAVLVVRDAAEASSLARPHRAAVVAHGRAVAGAGPPHQVVHADGAISQEQLARLEAGRQSVIPIHRLDCAKNPRLLGGELGRVAPDRLDLRRQGRRRCRRRCTPTASGMSSECSAIGNPSWLRDRVDRAGRRNARPTSSAGCRRRPRR